MRTHRIDTARASALALLLLSACDDPIDCPECTDDTDPPGAAALDLSETTIDFGEVLLGETARENFPVANSGTATLELWEVTVTEPFIARYDDGLTVTANSSAMLTIELTHSTLEDLSGDLSFRWNDPDAGDDGTLVEIPLSASIYEDTGF